MPDNSPGPPMTTRITDGETFAVTFCGASAGRLGEFGGRPDESGPHTFAADRSQDAARRLAPVEHMLITVRGLRFDPLAWLDDRAANDRRGETPPMAFPGGLPSQLVAVRPLSGADPDPAAVRPLDVAEHSQGLPAVAALDGCGTPNSELPALAQPIGIAADPIARRRDPARPSVMTLTTVNTAARERAAERLRHDPGRSGETRVRAIGGRVR
ncbi:hypothetical protein [Nocardia sp. BMG111209]|uniref:hypothetical protein n=1 Tax=Nocardia sp. BMG111209 TaxID=1160137 RepID=UPI00035D688B|nr:hypothetical protein [Nocardia sp. BMG111209]